MALFAPVCPPRIYKELFKDPTTKGTYFLLLAHEVFANEFAYAELFNPKSVDLNEGDLRWVHLDNSVIELGSSVSMDLLWDAANIVNADTIVLPDVLCNAQGTIDTTLKSYEDFMRLKNAVAPGNAGASRECVIIPQGETMSEWARCLETLTKELKPENIPWVGVPRNITGRIDTTRLNALRIIEGMLPKASIHLMGFSNDMGDDFICSMRPSVVGIDSAAPLRAPNFTFSGKVGPRGNWWNTVEYEPFIADNVRYIRKLLGDDPVSDLHMQRKQLNPSTRLQTLFLQ